MFLPMKPHLISYKNSIYTELASFLHAWAKAVARPPATGRHGGSWREHPHCPPKSEALAVKVESPTAKHQETSKYAPNSKTYQSVNNKTRPKTKKSNNLPCVLRPHTRVAWLVLAGDGEQAAFCLLPKRDTISCKQLFLHSDLCGAFQRSTLQRCARSKQSQQEIESKLSAAKQ